MRELTGDEDVLVWRSDKLHSLCCKQSHPFIDGIIRDSLVRTVE
jgi:hypothetical protein